MKYIGDKRSYIFQQFDLIISSSPDRKLEIKPWYIYPVGQQSTGRAAKRKENIGFQPEIKAKIRIIRIIKNPLTKRGQKQIVEKVCIQSL